MSLHGTFATALNCMDGRCQEKAVAFVKQHTGADYVDMITEPGIDGLLAGSHSVVPEGEIPARVEWVKLKASISADGHGSKDVTIFGHCACAGNQADLETHIEHLKEAKKVVEEWGLFSTIRLAVFNDAFELDEVA
jgi:hypothetical protein